MGTKKKNQTRKFHKIFSSILAAVFFLNSVLPANAQIASGKIQVESGLLGAYFIQNLRLPESIALTEQSFRGNAQETIWIIKDAHGVPAAQDSIANAISHLSNEAHVNLIGVEGVAGDFQTSFLRAYPDQDQLHEVLRDLWLRGELSGPAMAALSSENTARFFGAETPALYEAGLHDYLNARAVAPAYQAQLTNILSQIETLKNKTFSSGLADFEKNRAAFRNHQTEATAALLETASKKIGNFQKRFPHLSAISQEFKTNNAFSHQALLAWSEQVSQKIKDKTIRKEWSAKAQLWKTGGLSDAQFAAFTLRFCKEQGWSPRIPDELRALAQRGEILVRMRSSAFVSEWNAMLGALEAKLVSNKQEKALMVLTHQSELLQDWLKLELDRDTWKQVARKFESAADFRELGVEIESLRGTLINSDFAHFYQNAESRENALLENTLKQMHSEHRQSAALVVGGFHADILADILKKKNISHAVLTPAVAEVPKESRYDDLMRGNVSWKEYLRAENGKLKLYESFACAMTHKLLDLEGERQDPTRALANYKNWRENLSRGINGNSARENLRALSLLDEIVLESVYPNEYPALKKSWFKTAARIFPVLNRLNKLNPSNNNPAALQAMTNAPQIASPLVFTGASFTANSSELVASSPVLSGSRPLNLAAKRSEIRDVQTIAQVLYEGPNAKFGGLGDVGNDLPVAMQHEFQDKRVTTHMPWHEGRDYKDAKFLKEIQFDSPEGKVYFEIFEWVYKGATFVLYRKKFEGIFQGYRGDQFRTAALFSKAVVEYLAQSNIQPDVLHAHDQMSAYIPAFVRYTRESSFRNTGVIYTPHHLAAEYQGRVYDFDRAKNYLMGLGLNSSDLFSEGGVFYLRGEGHDRPHLNPVLAAIKLSDGVSTVDPEFAREAAEEGFDFTEGLRTELAHRRRNGTFIGIGNALNSEDWDPATSPIGHRITGGSQLDRGVSFEAGSDFFEWKAASRVWLQRQLGLNVDASAPVIFLASRLTRVKGTEAALQAIPHILQRFPNAQFVAAGIGEDYYVDGFSILAGDPAFRGRVSFRPVFLNEPEMRAAFAGATHFLSPTTIAPFEIAPSQAKPFGTPTVATKTGGLLRLHDPSFGDGQDRDSRLGYLFGGLLDASPAGLAVAMTEALSHHAYLPDYARRVSLNVRGAVPSWRPVTHKYMNFYRQILANRMDFIGQHDQAGQLRSQVSARSELRETPAVMTAVAKNAADLFFVHGAISALLDAMMLPNVTAPVSFEAIEKVYRAKYPSRYTSSSPLAVEVLQNTLDRLSEGTGKLLVKDARGYAPVNSRELAIKANYLAYIRYDLEKSLTDDLAVNAFQDYARIAQSGPLGPIEGRWAVLKAALLLNEAQRKPLLSILSKNKTLQAEPLAQAIVLMLKEKDSLGWLRQQIIDSVQKMSGAVEIPTQSKRLKVFAFALKDRIRLVAVKNAPGNIADTGLAKIETAEQRTVLADLLRSGLKSQDVNVVAIRNALTNELYHSALTVGHLARNGMSLFIPADSGEDWQALDIHRSEARLRKQDAFVNPTDFPHLSEHAVYSRQFEAGLPRHLLESLENAAKTGADALIAQFGFDPETAATLAAQVNLTGGLGALMPDLFEAWEANGLPVTGIHPLWNWIKNRPEKATKDGKRLYLGEVIKKFMEPAGIQEFEVKLNITPRYRGYAQNSRARELLTATGHKKIMVRVYQTASHFQKAPQKYLDAYYVEGGKEISVFGEVYDDDYALRDFQMAVFSQASQTLIQKIEGKEDPDDIVLLDHEVFVSLPASKLKSATLATLNHTVFRPGLYEPSENSYELLDFPEWMRPTIAHDGKVSIADYTAEAYDLLTGVGLVEHVPALRTNIFRWGWPKLNGWYDGKRRSTNGVYLPRWQSHPRRKLIEDYKKRLNIPAPNHGLPAEASDRDFFAELDKEANVKLKKDFMLKNEAVGASDAAELLSWLHQKHGIEWIKDSLHEFIGQSNVDTVIEDLIQMRKELNGLIEGGEKSDSEWAGFIQNRHALIQALLKDPIGANVRRQVPYKGPDKYVEILQDILLKTATAQSGEYVDAGALFGRIKEQVRNGDYSDAEFQRLRHALSNAQVSKEAREQMARVIIGGRTFDYGAYDRFLYIRFLANLLGLESRFATVENYNYHEARLIFKGAQAGIMLSDEILEASATSMEKAQTNMAEVIGVFGGAVPEIWIIRDKKTGEIKEVLDKDSDPAMTHDELRAKLHSDEWEILNGILVEYQDGSKSKQDGGLRRPSAASLLNALKQLRTTRSNFETRQVRMYDTLASSWKVDMVTSQAQAHAFLLEQTLKTKREKKQLTAHATVSDEDWVAMAHAESFVWDVQRENLHPSRRGGLIGFVSAFRWLKSWQKPHSELSDRMASRGEDAMAALGFHSKRGDIFNYLLKVLPALSDGAEPLRQKIAALQAQAAIATKERFVVALNTQAIELVDQYLLAAAGKWLDEYLADGTSPERLQELRTILEESAFVDDRKSEPQQPWAEYLARYLDHHPNAKALATSERGVRSFVFQKPGAQAVLVNLSVSAPSTDEGGVRKSRATIYLNEETAKILGGESYSERALFRVIEPKRGKEFKLHTIAELTESIGTGIEMPLGVEVIALQPAQADLAGLFYQAFQAKGYAEAVTQIEGRLQAALGVHIGEQKLTALETNGKDRDALMQQLQELVKLDPRSAEHLFTQDGRKAVMAFIFMVAPDLLNSVQNWHQDFFGKLKAIREKHWSFFQPDSKVRLFSSSRQGTLVLARQDQNGNLLFAPLLFHVPPSEINPDGKVNTAVIGHEGLMVSPAYQITDGITGDDYGTRSDLINSWMNRIPFADRAQFLVLKPARSEMRGGAEEQARNSSSRALNLDSVPALNRSEDRTKTLSPVQLSGATSRTTTGLTAFVKTVTRTFRLPGESRLREQISAPGYAAVTLAEQHPTHHVPAVIVAQMQERADQNVLSRQNAAEFLAGNGLTKFVTAHFAKHPEMPLHLGFTIPYESGLDEMLLNYDAQITKMQRESKFGALIHNHLTVLVAPKQKVSANFAANTKRSRIVVKWLNRGRAAAEIKTLLANERHVFAYGLEKFGVNAEQLGDLRAMVVSGNFSAEAIFNPAVMLNMATAANSNITADLVQQVSLRYEQFVRFRQGSLALRDSILQGALIELQVRELIASMA